MGRKPTNQLNICSKLQMSQSQDIKKLLNETLQAGIQSSPDVFSHALQAMEKKLKQVQKKELAQDMQDEENDSDRKESENEEKPEMEEEEEEWEDEQELSSDETQISDTEMITSDSNNVEKSPEKLKPKKPSKKKETMEAKNIEPTIKQSKKIKGKAAKPMAKA